LNFWTLPAPLQVFYEAVNRGLDRELLFTGTAASLVSEQGLTIADLLPYPGFRADDDVFIPGFTLERTPVPPDLVAAIRRAHQAGARIVSTCSATFLLGEAGLLDGRACTTHWKRLDQLQKTFPRAQVLSDRLFVEDRGVITCGGVTCGIDLALALMEDERGPLFASQIAKELVLYIRRDKDHSQISVYLQFRSHQNPGVHAVQDWMIEHPDQGVSLETLAQIGGMSPRNFTRAFRVATGVSPGDYRTRLRLERASMLLKNPKLTVEAVASEAGFGDARALRRSWTQHYGRSPRQEITR
jgi:transcriptional regulator GlxA family with amidase domain